MFDTSRPETALATSDSRAVGYLAGLADTARDYIGQAKAPATVRAYRSDWRDFTAWAAAHGLAALPAEPSTVALYLSALAGERKASTLRRRLSAISQAHKAAGHQPPKDATLTLTWQGICRTHGTAETGKAAALTADIRAMVENLPSGMLGVRDRALLLLGFAGALRRSELVALDVGDVAFTGAGLVVTIRRSKTDQAGQGQKIGIPHGGHAATCPVRALRAWLDVVKIGGEGAIFRPVTRHGAVLPSRLSDRAVALAVKRAAEGAGLDASQYAGHSLRAGLATSAAAAGVSERVIMAQTRHKSVTVARRYIRDGSLFRENAAGGVGL